MPKISELPETTGSINVASLLPLVQSGSTTKTTFATLSSNFASQAIKSGTWTASFKSTLGNTNPIYTAPFDTDFSNYILFNNKFVLFNISIYADTVSNGGTGPACVTLPTVFAGATYNFATACVTWHQKFQLQNNNSSGTALTELGFGVSVGASTLIRFRALNTLSSAGGSPDLSFSGSAAGAPNIPVVAGMGVTALGWGILN